MLYQQVLITSQLISCYTFQLLSDNMVLVFEEGASLTFSSNPQVVPSDGSSSDFSHVATSSSSPSPKQTCSSHGRSKCLNLPPHISHLLLANLLIGHNFQPWRSLLAPLLGSIPPRGVSPLTIGRTSLCWTWTLYPAALTRSSSPQKTHFKLIWDKSLLSLDLFLFGIK